MVKILTRMGLLLLDPEERMELIGTLMTDKCNTK